MFNQHRQVIETICRITKDRRDGNKYDIGIEEVVSGHRNDARMQACCRVQVVACSAHKLDVSWAQSGRQA